MSELSNVHSILNLSDELEQGKFSVDYIMDESKKCVGVSHPDWPFTIMKNKHNKCEAAIVCNNTDEPFGILDSDVFNTILMSWLLIDDPNLIDEGKIDDEWISVDENNNYPDPEKHKFILGIDMNDSEPYVFECEWDGDTWSNIGGEAFTHWKPSVRPK